MSRTAQLYLQNLQQIINAVHELRDQNSSRFDQRVKFVIENMFGYKDHEGYLKKRVKFYIEQIPLLWIEEVEDLSEMVGLNSNFMRKIAERANNVMQIQGQLLPQNVLHQFQHTEMHQSRIIAGLKRNSSTSPFMINMLEWLFAKILHRFINLPELYFKKAINDDQQEDQMFFYLSRNFYLIFLRKMMISLKQISSPLFDRATSLIHSYVIGDLIFKFKKANLKKQEIHHDVYYKLKSHYIQLLYLVMSLNKPLNEQTVSLYYEYLIKITQNYSQITNFSENDNINMIGRLWISLLCRNQPHQSLFMTHLSKSNKLQGWFRLERLPLNHLYDCIKNLKVNSKQLKQSLMIKGNILSLIKKKSQWSPSFGMLRVIQTIMTVNHISSFYAKNSHHEQQNLVIVNAVNRLFDHFFKEGKYQTQIRQLYSNVKMQFEAFCKGDLPLAVEFSNNSQKQEISTLQNRYSLNRFKPSMNNVWNFPLQPSELKILYDLTYKASQNVDRLFGYKQQEPPKTNLRIFSNLFVVLCMLIALYLALL